MDIADVLCRESCENDTEFEARRILTLKVAALPDPEINPMTAVVLASMMVKKAKFGLFYDEQVEKTLARIISQLQ